MAIHNVNLPYNGYSAINSGYGSVPWMPGNGNLVANSIPAGLGTKWAYWRIQNAGVPPGEPLTGITLSGGNDFTVGGGGVTKTRLAGLYVRVTHAFDDFAATQGQSVDTLTGTGTGKTLGAVLTPAGFTSNDLINGTLYIGVAVDTSTGDAADGSNATFRYGALACSVSTGVNQPTPPPGTPGGILTNPIGNTSPGKYPGGQFASLSFRLTSPDSPQTSSLRYSWTFDRTGLTFPDGSVNLIQTNTAGGGISGLVGNTGLINIASNVTPRDITIRCQVSNVSGASPTGISYYSPLTVNARRIGHVTEF